MASQLSIPTLDRISALPDSVICHILSFLSTKQSASTSILSKRWKPLWLSVLTLDFDDDEFADFDTFRLFVYSVMLARNMSLPLRSFSIRCFDISFGFNPHDVNRFIEAAVQRGIQKLNLDMSPIIDTWTFKLPTCVFSCISLTVLKLRGLNIHDLPDVNFPLLKTLHLDSISFLSSGAQGHRFLKRLLSGCPILEDLHATNLFFIPFGDKKVNGLHKLVRANINLIYNMPFAWVRNAKFLCAELRQPYEYKVPTFPNLTHMEIVFQLENDWLRKWNWLAEVLQNCPNLQNLTIHEDSFSFRNEIAEGDWMDPPIVPECLSSQLKTCSLIAFKGMKCELQFAEYILKSAKTLHTLKISASPVDLNTKLQILMKLSLCPRGSTTCKLSFD